MFCAGGAVPGNPMSGEHLWSDWISRAKLLPKGGEYDETFALLRPSLAEPVFQFDQSRQGSPATKKVRVVCRSCNSGWMSEMETEAKPFLGPLIAGQPIALNAQAKRTLERWVALKVLVADNLSYEGHPPNPVFDQTVREAFKETRIIPVGFKIWIGRQNGAKWETGFLRRAASLGFTASLQPSYKPRGFGHNIQTVTWGIGKLLIYVIASSEEILMSHIVELFRAPAALVQIRPNNGKDILWPINIIFTDRTIDRLAASVSEVIDSAIWV